ncbi:hypothetical protein KAH55_05425, partial [bacterium]|nr:hypothetical protein [bacterium]
MQTNHYKHQKLHIGLLALAILILLIPQTGWAKWKVEHYEQAQNGDGDGPYSWTTGNLGQNASAYYENDGVPFRLHFTSMTPGTHTVLLEYKYIKSSKMAYDYLVTWDYTEHPNLSTDIPSFPWGGPSTFPIPLDPVVAAAGVVQNPGNFTIYNGTITGASSYTSIPGSGDEDKQLTLTFTTTETEVLITWAGHVSSEADWGVGNSAVNISGSPYHMKLINFDGAATGQRDLQMAADAIVLVELDLGDAPDSYATLLASNGANHVVTPNLNLGATIDAEADGLPTPGADGDDLNATADEDGVTFPVPLVAGLAATINVDGGPSGGELDAWIDFNGNGQFDHPSELLTGATVSLSAGANVVPIMVPVAAVPGPTYARFRLSTAGGLSPDGPADDGEVEDYT